MWNFFLIVKIVQLICKVIVYLICVLNYTVKLIYSTS
nr:MAG TPA: hypothetical protein [Bacteriophage sp.]DAH37803.1 MAG TPA: hypothetical protein [Caudoviricetes sp.]